MREPFSFLPFQSLLLTCVAVSSAARVVLAILGCAFIVVAHCVFLDLSNTSITECVIKSKRYIPDLRTGIYALYGVYPFSVEISFRLNKAHLS